MDGLSGSKPAPASPPESSAATPAERDEVRAVLRASRERFANLLEAPPEGESERPAATLAGVIAPVHHSADVMHEAAVTQPQGMQSNELQALLDRLCSQLHVAQPARADHTHLVLSFDDAAAGLAAEILRDGAFLRVRLHTADAATLRALSNGRDRLHAALNESTSLHVAVEIIHQEDCRRGS